MSTWEDDFREVASFFHREGRPRPWVFIVVISLAAIVAALLFTRALAAPEAAPEPEPTATPSAEPVAEEITLSSLLLEGVEAEWRRAATPGCLESLTTGVPRGTTEAAFLDMIAAALTVDGAVVERSTQGVTVTRSTEQASSVAVVTVKNSATVVCMN